MAERLRITPPEIIEVDGPVVFLAGPIQGAPEWQTHATNYIHDIEPTIVVASPRKDYPEGTFVYERQVDWETHYLRLAAETGAIAFWLAKQVVDTPGRAYAQTTRFELAEWKMHHQCEGVNLALGIEEGFGNARYITRRFNQDAPDIEIVDTLKAVCENAAKLALAKTVSKSR